MKNMESTLNECGKPDTQRNLLGGCRIASGMLIKRHDIIVEEIYNKIIENKPYNKYDNKLKLIKLEKGFVEKEKQIKSIINEKRIKTRHTLYK